MTIQLPIIEELGLEAMPTAIPSTFFPADFPQEHRIALMDHLNLEIDDNAEGNLARAGSNAMDVEERLEIDFTEESQFFLAEEQVSTDTFSFEKKKEAFTK